MKKQDKKTVYNLATVAPLLYKTIEHYNISKLFIAKQLYSSEWDNNDESQKQKLTVRFRNKMDGNGKLTNDELVQIQNILMEMADTIKNNVGKTILNRSEHKKEKIKKLLENLDKLDDDNLNNLLNTI